MRDTRERLSWVTATLGARGIAAPLAVSLGVLCTVSAAYAASESGGASGPVLSVPVHAGSILVSLAIGIARPTLDLLQTFRRFIRLGVLTNLFSLLYIAGNGAVAVLLLALPADAATAVDPDTDAVLGGVVGVLSAGGWLPVSVISGWLGPTLIRTLRRMVPRPGDGASSGVPGLDQARDLLFYQIQRSLSLSLHREMSKLAIAATGPKLRSLGRLLHAQVSTGLLRAEESESLIAEMEQLAEQPDGPDAQNGRYQLLQRAVRVVSIADLHSVIDQPEASVESSPAAAEREPLAASRRAP